MFFEQQHSLDTIGTLSVPSTLKGSKADTSHRNSWATCQTSSVIFMLFKIDERCHLSRCPKNIAKATELDLSLRRFKYIA